jgi:hypothetical protein
MKLELKHLAPYLPYGLKVLANQRQRTLHGISQDVAYLYYNGLKPYFFKEFKPILRPLSEFTYDDIMQIREHLGIGQWCDYYDTYFDAWFDDACSIHKFVLQCPYDIMQFFLECKFDVFNLIPQGLAIDINTLNKKI